MNANAKIIAGDQVRGESGIAVLTVMLLLLIMTVLGLAAITVTGLENRMAGFAMSSEVSATAAESCLSTAVNIIQQTIDPINGGAVPPAYSPSPVPTASKDGPPTLTAEIIGQADNDPDSPTGSGAAGPDISFMVASYAVNGDIDRLYGKANSGSGLQFAAGYEGVGGGAAAGGVDLIYQVDCRATLVATGTTSRVVAVYACNLTGETCQRKI